MNTGGARGQAESLSWHGLLFGVWPFILAGPVMAVLPYLPRPISQLFSLNSPGWLATVGLSLGLGLIVGWRRGFPRWVYPYLVSAFFALMIPLLGWLAGRLGPSRSNPWVATALILFTIVGLGAAALFLAGRLAPTRKILDDVREDWTCLSFGMFVFVALGTGFYGGDHLPPFGPGVWLPSVIVVVGAAAYLLARRRRVRGAILLATLGLGVLGKIVFPNDDAWALWPLLLLILLIAAPAIAGLLPHSQPRPATEN